MYNEDNEELDLKIFSSSLQLIFLFNSVFRALSILKIAGLQYLSSKSSVWASRRIIYIDYFFLVWGHCLLFLYIPLEFLLKIRHFEYYHVATLEIRCFFLPP